MKKLAVVTVADDAFAAGAIVLAYSFAKHHPATPYDFIVIDAGLNDENKERLALFDGLCLKKPSEDLLSGITALANAFSHLNSGKQIQFYSLDLFHVNGYEKVLFCDSDLVFLDDIGKGLLALDGAFIACPDYCHYKGCGYDLESFEIIEKDSPQPGIRTSFNSGLMYIDQSLLTPENFRKMTGYLSSVFWKNIKSPHTDQVVFNHIFKDFRQRLPLDYNYLLNRRPQLQELTGVTPLQAKVLHFNGPKPWQFDRARTRMMEDPLMIPIYKLWLKYYMEAMQYLSIKQKVNRDELFWRSA